MTVIDIDDLDDVDTTSQCPVCNGPSASMGGLGTVEWHGCQKYGTEHYVQLKKENEKP